MSKEFAGPFWNRCLEQMGGYGDFLEGTAVEDSPQGAVEAADYLMMTLASAYILVMRSDPDYPEFVPNINHLFPYSGANPDATYYFATISGEGTYRIFGHRNTVHWINFMTGYDYLGFAEVLGKGFPSNDMDEFALDVDGSFEILLSTIRPEGHTGNWIKLEPTVTYLLVRQFANRPDEVDARMGIERLDRSGPPKLYSVKETENRVLEIIRHMRRSSTSITKFPQRFKDNVNQLKVADYGGVGPLPMTTQIYHEGLYKIELDEAMILEVKVPTCHYWNIQLADKLWRTLDFIMRRCSLNGYKDRADSDGVTRLVIAHHDPGVENWVDACGVTEGDIVMRWLYADAVPNPVTKVVPLGDVLKYLPADTAQVTPQQRAKDLREWTMARQLRRSW